MIKESWKLRSCKVTPTYIFLVIIDRIRFRRKLVFSIKSMIIVRNKDQRENIEKNLGIKVWNNHAKM